MAVLVLLTTNKNYMYKQAVNYKYLLMSFVNCFRFIPNCRSDGTFDSEQCYNRTLRCWCVTPEGIPLPYTSWTKATREEPSRCDRKKTTRRRSPSRNNHKARPCKTADKAQLNTNLINSFHSEFTR